MVISCFCGDCFIVVYVFFFKQKTAYEMRISDWSSDVCSSDLVVAQQGAEFGLGEALHTGLVADQRQQPAQPNVRAAEEHSVRRRGHRQIGRASCRERVCQYV